MYLVFIPILMIFIMEEYINALEYDIAVLDSAPTEYLFSHGQLLVMHLPGLSNVKAVAEKYDGAMSIETRGDVFVLRGLLISPRHPEGSSRQSG